MPQYHSLKKGLTIFLLILCSACSSLSLDQANNPLTGISEVKAVATGFISTEGPVWHATNGTLLFSDIPGDTIYSFNVSNNTLSKLRSPSSSANGLALDTEGYLLAAEQQSRTISRMNLDTGEVSPFISSVDHQGSQHLLNSPNDMAVHANGNVYFTDPPFGLRGEPGELGFNGVFVRKASGEIELIKRFETGTNPNGIIFNPDQSTLYLAVSHDESAPIIIFDVDANGNLSNERDFVSGQNNDGMAVDKNGNLYVANRTGVSVWSAAGNYWGMISLPDNIRTTNVAFGGEDMNTLYITNRSVNLYAVTLNIVGHQ